ncbi:hypothetical protein [Paenibacillus jiagnxiensis]|uniref:hypothetical protein n=1 Tax=Paenibacillus jiagnxiensis TaxID=3228926 RepID=UPI0033AD80C3
MDETKKSVQAISQKVEEAVREGVPYHVAFDESFMAAYTNAPSFGRFIQDSGLGVRTEDEWDLLEPSVLDKYVRASTSFATWEEMQQKAGEAYLMKLLDLHKPVIPEDGD